MTLFDTEPGSWDEVRDEALACRACPLWEPAGDTVFGEGPVPARIMLVGEQPGDQEDRQNRPFVGPAGKVLDDALAEADLDRAELYVTNAVKHFKFVPAGQASHPPDADGRRGEGVPPVAPRRAGSRAAGAAGAARAPPRRRRCSARSSGSPSTGARRCRPTRLRRHRHHPPLGRAPDEPAQRDEYLAGLVADLRTARKLAGV